MIKRLNDVDLHMITIYVHDIYEKNLKSWHFAQDYLYYALLLAQIIVLKNKNNKNSNF